MSQKLETLSGIHVVAEALRARRRSLRVLYLAKDFDPKKEDFRHLADTAKVRRVEISRAELDRMVPNSRHQGVALLASPIPESDLGEVLVSSSILLASDGIEDPQNFGALLRVADAMGASGLITTRRRASPTTLAVGKASAGAVEHVPIVRVTNLRRALGLARDSGFWIIAADSEGETSLYSPEVDRLWRDRVLLVLGSEGKGLRPDIRKTPDVVIRIPMQGRVESLNVTNAAAVILSSRAHSRKSGA